MHRRVFSRELKLEAVKLVRDRGVAQAQAQAQASRDLDVAESVGDGCAIWRLIPCRLSLATARYGPSSRKLAVYVERSPSFARSVTS